MTRVMGEEQQVETALAKEQQQTPSPARPSAAGVDPCSVSSSRCHGSCLGRTELVLRGVALVASIASLVFFVTDKQTRSFTVYTSVVVQEAVYSDMKALVCAVIVLGVVALHSVLQILRCLCGPSSASIVPASAIAWTIFLLDQVTTYLLLSSGAAVAQAAWFSEQGNDEFGWPKVCYLYEKFCKQIGSGVVGCFVACVALAFTSVISAFNLFVGVDFAE